MVAFFIDGEFVYQYSTKKLILHIRIHIDHVRKHDDTFGWTHTLIVCGET